jgi:RHS repeat-associated protein
MDSLGRLTQFQRGSLLGVNVTTPSPIGVQARNWSLDHANNWANYTSTQGGATSFASRNHTVTNELVQQVAASNTSYAYDANGNLVTDGVNHYKWDFKNRLREVWTTTNGTPDEIVAKYWYDAENRRIRKQTFQDQSMVDYYIDGMREIQETPTCTGIPLRQYVHGPILDEVLVRDELLPDYVAGLVSKCNTRSVNDNFIDSLAECANASITPFVLTGTCGPCEFDANVTLSASMDSACSICAQHVTSLVAAYEGGPTPSCLTCFDLALLNYAGVLSEWSFTASCQPCEYEATLHGDISSTFLQANGEWDCLPCPPSNTKLIVHIPEATQCTLGEASRIYYHQNEQQSVFAVTNQTGVVLEGYAFDPYGATLTFKPGVNGVVEFGGDDIVAEIDASALSVWTYTGRRYDSESGLLYYRTRYLDSEMGRFISRDTIGVWGDPASLGNGYLYARNSPLRFLDPHGTCTSDDGTLKCAEQSCERLGGTMVHYLGGAKYDDWCILPSSATDPFAASKPSSGTFEPKVWSNLAMATCINGKNNAKWCQARHAKQKALLECNHSEATNLVSEEEEAGCIEGFWEAVGADFLLKTAETGAEKGIQKWGAKLPKNAARYVPIVGKAIGVGFTITDIGNASDDPTPRNLCKAIASSITLLVY